MPTLSKKLTDTIAKSGKDCPAPDEGYVIYWCAKKDGFGVRVSHTGDRAWINERRVNGKTVRRTLGKAEGRGTILATAARELALDVSSGLSKGIDRAEIKKEERKVEGLKKKDDERTFRVALDEYLDGKRRTKDGLPLKERTKNDYRYYIRPSKTFSTGKVTREGELVCIADKPISKITGDDLRNIYNKTIKLSERQASYALQIIRSVMNWHGVKVPNSPLGDEVAGRDRIVLAPTTSERTPIPLEYLGKWWQTACNIEWPDKKAADLYRFQLLTGCRGVEIKGDRFGNEPIRVRNFDLVGERIVVVDTKNRKNLTLLLSRQLMEIVKRNIEGKKPDELIFDVAEPEIVLRQINESIGCAPDAFTGHDLRSTFSSVAEDLVSSYTLKRLINHTDDDVTGGYIKKSETQLRIGWQAVADFIESVSKSKVLPFVKPNSNAA